MPRDVHLLVLIHGLWGTPAHLEACRQEAVKAHGAAQHGQEELRVLVANGSEGTLTYDGVEIFASRVGYQIDTLIEEVEKEGGKVTLFSVLGYSLGGLVARYLLGLLHSRSPSFFTLHRPYSFATIATPHLGIPKYTGSLLSGVFHSLGSRLLSRTGEQLYVVDKEEGGRALLEVMADPDEVFLQALNEFERIDIFANGCQDRTVPYPTASFSSFDPFTPLVAAHSIEDELVIETDADRLIKRYTRRPGAFDDVLAGGEKELRVGGGGWRAWIPGKKAGRSKAKKDDKKLKKTHPPKLPPFLQFRWPFNYVLYVVFPLVFPVLLILILTRFLLDSSRSRKRMTALRKLKMQHPALLAGDTEREGNSNGTATPTPFQPNGLSVDHLRQLIRRAERRLEGGLVDAVENGGMGEEDEDAVDSGLGSPSDGGANPSDGLVSRAQSGANTPSRFDPSAPDTSIDPALLPPSSLPPPKVRLTLSPAQQRMVADLDGGLDKRKLRKWIAWFPEAQNSHSVIIVRDPKQFTTHEEGRGVLRKWASLTVPPRETSL